MSVVNEHTKNQLLWKRRTSLIIRGVFLVVVMLMCVVLINPMELFAGMPQQYTYKLIKRFPHDPKAFTQGLIVDDGRMIEGTGEYGDSELRLVEVETGVVKKSLSLNRKYFGEGIAVFGDEVFQLTWKENAVFVYDRKTLEYKRTMQYQGEGWGLTSDGTHLILSDGTSTLRWLDPKTLREVRRVKVKLVRKEMNHLNELEYIDDEIYANVWYSDQILKISSKTGEVTGVVELKGLNPVKRGIRNTENVLNGIAWDKEQKRLYVTGKNWSSLYEIEIVKK